MSGIYEFSIKEPFDFAIHEDFRLNIDKAIEENSNGIVINLSSVETLDSSAIGMLIIAHKRAIEKNINIKVVGVNSVINEMLKLTQIDKLFEITTR